MAQYSVLLLYPDSLSAYAGETFFTSMDADTPQEAVNLARWECLDANTFGDRDPNDLRLLLLIEGQHADLAHLAQEATPTPEENPYDHDSSYSGCREGCEACAWEAERNV